MVTAIERLNCNQETTTREATQLKTERNALRLHIQKLGQTLKVQENRIRQLWRHHVANGIRGTLAQLKDTLEKSYEEGYLGMLLHGSHLDAYNPGDRPDIDVYIGLTPEAFALFQKTYRGPAPYFNAAGIADPTDDTPYWFNHKLHQVSKPYAKAAYFSAVKKDNSTFETVQIDANIVCMPDGWTIETLQSYLIESGGLTDTKIPLRVAQFLRDTEHALTDTLDTTASPSEREIAYFIKCVARCMAYSNYPLSDQTKVSLLAFIQAARTHAPIVRDGIAKALKLYPTHTKAITDMLQLHGIHTIPTPPAAGAGGGPPMPFLTATTPDNHNKTTWEKSHA